MSRPVTLEDHKLLLRQMEEHLTNIILEGPEHVIANLCECIEIEKEIIDTWYTTSRRASRGGK